MSDIHERYDPTAHEPLPEGEEAPPPFVHTMAIVRWIIFGSMCLFALVMVLGHFDLNPLAAVEKGPAQYHCPMHPTYVSNQPGECPICGMSLVPIADKGDTTMTIVGDRSGHDSSVTAAAKPGQYTCPMDPDVVSDKPGKCPKCGMNLVKVQAAAGTTPEKTSPGGVHGLVPVTIEPERLQLIGLRTGPVERRAIGGNVRLVGFVTPDETRVTNVHVRVNGWVQDLFVDQTGELVQAGQLLLSLYSPDLFQAEQDFIIARDAAAKPATDSTLTQMRAQLVVAARQRLQLLGLSSEDMARLETADLLSPTMALRSPFAGYVMDKSVLRGQYIGPDQNLLTIADLSTVWVLADVYERDLEEIHVGQRARLHLAALPGEVLDGQVTFIYPAVSEKTRTLKVRLEFPNPSLRLRPGMYAEIEVDRGDGMVLAVPADAVMDGGEIQYAFVVHDQTHFEPRLLKIGRTADDWVEVLSGLSEGETVVTSANFLIDSESRLKAAISGLGGAPAAATHAGHQQ